MTRPVYEPSYARTDRKLGFTGDQLLRRPAPQATAGVPASPWIRLKQTDLNQHIAANDFSTIIYDDVCNPYPDIFDPYIETPEVWGVNFLVNGLFQATSRISPLTDFPDSGFELLFYSVDWDVWGPYSNSIFSPLSDVPNTSLNGYAEVTFRAGIDDDINNPWRLRVDVITGADALDVGPGTYLEVRMLGTDPFFPQGLDNDVIECGMP